MSEPIYNSCLQEILFDWNAFFLTKYSEPDSNICQWVFRFKNLLIIIKLINKCIVKTIMNYDLHQYLASK